MACSAGAIEGGLVAGDRVGNTAVDDTFPVPLPLEIGAGAGGSVELGSVSSDRTSRMSTDMADDQRRTSAIAFPACRMAWGSFSGPRTTRATRMMTKRWTGDVSPAGTLPL